MQPGARRRPLALCPLQPESDPGWEQKGQRRSEAPTRASERECQLPEVYLEDMEEKFTETNSNVDSSAQPSVAQLAGRFREQAAVAKETPASKQTRRKPPCSLPLFPPKVELGQNGEEVSAAGCRAAGRGFPSSLQEQLQTAHF